MSTPEILEGEEEIVVVPPHIQAGSKMLSEQRRSFSEQIAFMCSMLFTDRNEREKLLVRLEHDCSEVVKALASHGIDTEGAPTWEQIQGHLDKDILSKILPMKKPTLLLVPPVPRNQMIQAVNAKHEKNEKAVKVSPISILEPHNDSLWNAGISETETRHWRVKIVEGEPEIPPSPSTGHKNSVYKIAKETLKRYNRKGMDVMNDANTYLTLAILSAHYRDRIDQHHFTVLNSRMMSPTSPVAEGYYHDDQIRLCKGNAPTTSVSYRFRGELEIDLNKNTPASNVESN